MIREAIGHALLLAAEAVGALPVPRQWERDLDELRQQIGDLDAAVADKGDKAASDEIDRLKADVAWLRTELIDATRDADAMTARLDAARDGLRTARSCLDREGVPLLGDAITAVERGLAKSASSLSDITTPKPSDAATPDPTAEQIEAYLRGSVEWVAQTHSELPMGRNWWEHHVSGTGVRITNANGGDALGWIAEAEGVTLAEMRARILGAGKVAAEAAEPTLRDIAEDPRPGDRLILALDSTTTWKDVIAVDAQSVDFNVTHDGGGSQRLRWTRDAWRSAMRQDPRWRLENEPTDDDLGRIARAQANSLGYDAAGRALYNLGREHGGRAASAIATESIAMATKWRMAEAENAALLARAEKAELRLSSQTTELLMLRGIDDRMMSMGRSYDWLREHTRENGEAIKVCGNLTGPSLADQIRDLVAKWQKQGEDLEAVRKELCATRSSLTHVLDCVSEARMQLDRDEVSKALDALDAVENGLAKADSAPIDKAAEPRDTLADPRPGLFVDQDGELWICGRGPLVARPEQMAELKEFIGLRPATDEEIAKILGGHNL